MPDETTTADADQTRAARLASIIYEGATSQERDAIYDWLRSLNAIARGNESTFEKARRAIEETWQRQVIWPIVKLVGGEVKRHAWDDRGPSARIAGVGVLAALAIGGSEAGAGIAALGTAVGVPLWIVFAAGGSLAGTLLAEIQRLASSNSENQYEKADQGKESERHTANSKMSCDEALKILELGLGATEDEIDKVYKRLMKNIHPDAGGSMYFASQLNQARDRAIQCCRSGR